MARLNLITSQFNLIIFEKMIKLNQLMITMFPYTIFPVTPLLQREILLHFLYTCAILKPQEISQNQPLKRSVSYVESSISVPGRRRRF